MKLIPFYLAVFILSGTIIQAGCATTQEGGAPQAASEPAANPAEEELGPEKPLEPEYSGKTSEAPPAGESDALYRRFNEARRTKQLRAASEIAGQILARNPNDVRVMNALSIMNIEQGKYEMARLFIGKVLAKDPNNSAALNNLGVIELKTDNLRQALVQFKRAIILSGKNRAAHANLGAIYLQYRNYQNAAAELEAAYDNGDESPETLSNLAFALSGLGQVDRAAKMYEKATSKQSANPAILYNYAVLLIEKANRPKDGLKLLNKIRFTSTEPGIIERANNLARKAEGRNGQEKENPLD
jgi:Flp pilus assembly protein TadD